ncbi:MAG: transporter substrate-binding domain-containing protein [Colwellia sp.]|nr:transporter substrate-binding domain-containing protein [Colwellia sp.]
MNTLKVVCFVLCFSALFASATTMKVCIDHYPPLQILTDVPKGESIEVLEVLAKLLGHDIEYIPGPNFARCLRMLELGQVDVLAGLVDDPARRTFAQFVAYQEDDSYIFVSRIDTADIVSFDDLEKHIVGLTKNTKYFKELEFEQDISKVLIKDIITGLKMLLLKRIDVVVTSAPILQSIQNELGNINDKVKVNPYSYNTSRQLCFGFSKKSKLIFTADDMFKIKQAAQQQVFSKAIEKFKIANPELYSNAEPFSNNE